MKLKPVGLLVAVIVTIFRLYAGDYDQADKKLVEFYSQISKADFDAATASIDRAIQLWPGNARYYGWRGYVESQLLPPQCPEKMQATGLAFDDKYRAMARQAAADYRHETQLNDRNAIAYFNLSWLDHILQDDGLARSDVDRAIAIDPENAVFRIGSGMLLEEQGDIDGAKAEYQGALEISPSIVDSPFFKDFRLRRRVIADDVLGAAITHLESNLLKENNPIWEARLGKLELFGGQTARANDLLLDAARQLPNLPLVWSNLGQIRELQGDSADAVEFYNKARTIRSSLPEPYLHIAQIEQSRGRTAIASQQFFQAVRLWQTATALTAPHNNRLYNGPYQRIDDLLPTTFVWYVTPCVASRAWEGLAQLHPERQNYPSNTRTCENLPAPHTFIKVN